MPVYGTLDLRRIPLVKFLKLDLWVSEVHSGVNLAQVDFSDSKYIFFFT